MKVHQAGFRSVVGLMGSALYGAQRHVLLERFRHVILLLDGDATGRKASTAIARTLRPHCQVRVVLLPDAVQPDQLPAKDIGRVLLPSANDD
jgi:DNA primase